MTKKEAVIFLTQACIKSHRVIRDVPQPSPVGTPPVFNARKSCACLNHNPRTGEVSVADEHFCNCGAREHNQKVQEALITLGSPS